MKKDLAIIAGLFVLVALLLVFGQGFTSVSFLSGNQASLVFPSKSAASENVNVTIGSLTVEAKTAINPQSRKRGLSKIDSIAFNQGMLFVFENPGQYGIWMKDMKFAIDVLWLDENKKVVDIAVDVPPQQGLKDSELTIYKPSHNSKYVLEVNAGLVNLNGVRVGDKASFEI